MKPSFARDPLRLDQRSAMLHQAVTDAIRHSPGVGGCIHRLARKYVWWKTPEEALSQPERVIAQVMNIGDFEDVRALAAAVGVAVLVDVLRHAQAGEFSPRSWHYWHYRLGLAALDRVPAMPARKLGGVGEPAWTDDATLLVASLDDLMATKVKVTLQRVESKDYRDVAAPLIAGTRLERGLASARQMFGNAFQPSEALKALVCFEGGDLHVLTDAEKRVLVNAVSAVRDLPEVCVVSRALVGCARSQAGIEGASPRSC